MTVNMEPKLLLSLKSTDMDRNINMIKSAIAKFIIKNIEGVFFEVGSYFDTNNIIKLAGIPITV